MRRVWQLPVKQSDLTDHDWVHKWSKYHAFINKDSICGKHGQDTDFFETGVDESEIIENPSIACKKCFELAGDHYCHECKNSRHFYKLRAVEEKEVTAINDEFLERGEITKPVNIITLTYCSKCNGLMTEPMERKN
ncbi:hypothetical protein ACQKEX_14600 [Bacillus pumilus]|uniref:hypothetical protein n=1 Tax=Bacillus TaxID=1386 RepID=UPI000959AE09|nr:hypothetical protein [Bacillus pumilus]MBU8576440.1 hypothetical protein [Bacillus pumilus]OLP64360.1 hypothetical protein BACPU_25850 [Bacillus pumilus]